MKERIMSTRQFELSQLLRSYGVKDNHETARRMIEMYDEFFSGVGQDESEPLQKQFMTDSQMNLVAVKDIQFTSMCEHHLLPFTGTVSIAYKTSNFNVTGLSKLARVVDIVSHRPQMQERMTVQIAKAFEKAFGGTLEGVIVRVEAEHTCMSLRGVKKMGATTVTDYNIGFSESEKLSIMSTHF